MSLWGANSSSGIKPVPPKIRVERVPATNKQNRTTSTPQRAHQQGGTPKSTSGHDLLKNRSHLQQTSSLEPHKRKAVRQKSPQRQRVDSDSDDDESSVLFNDFSLKRQRLAKTVDLKRRLRTQDLVPKTSELNGLIHAADITDLGRKPKSSAEPMASSAVAVSLQYPSAYERERYYLVCGKERIDPFQEIIDVARIITDVYMTNEEALPFTDPNTGIIRKLDRAKNILAKDNSNQKLLDGFKDAVTSYNDALRLLVQTNVLPQNLDAKHHLPFDMVLCILKQVYDRAVSPKVDMLRQYENGTDNVYGELLPPFTSKILAETGLKSDQVFVDLGSGVGNVVLQAALEIGCESWGCEMMENACTLAKAQEREFTARCRLWGINTGAIRLIQDDFLENDLMKATMRRADVILVNNQAFTPQLNRRLIDLFLDLKDGCKIISLRSFVPHDHKITSRNMYDPVNVLNVVKGEYFDKSVSWTDVGGNYFIATKDSRNIERYATA